MKDILKIKEELEKLKEQFLQSEKPAQKKDRALFERVKTETSPLFNLNEQWATKAEQYLKEHPGGAVHPLQLKNTRENIELVILHSYYIDVPKKRFMELYNSIHYVLDQLVEGLRKESTE
nr:DUF1798 family protein [Pontibacillus sp. HN14]